MSGIAIVSPGYPEQPGGVTDHTERLRRAWSTKTAVRAEGRLDHLGSAPEQVVRDWEAAGLSAVLLQYVPFLYARFGLSSLPAAIAQAARRHDMRVTVFVHETWVPPTRAPWVVLSPLQRRQLRRLCRLADCVVTAVPAWRDLLGDRTELLYVGSNLGEPPDTFEPVDAPVVFSPFAAGLRWDWVAAAITALGADPGAVIVGGDAATARTHPATRGWFDPSWDWRGYLPSSNALRVVGGGPLALTPFLDGATGRRGSLLALLSTGVPVISSTGHLADPLFAAGPLRLASSREEFVRAALDTWSNRSDLARKRRQRQEWYRLHLHPATLDDRLLDIVAGERP